jgi:hypothetical protein
MAADDMNWAEHLLAIRQQLASLQEELVAIRRQQQTLCELVGRLLPPPPALSAGPEGRGATAKDFGGTQEPSPPLPAQEVLAECAQDILRVLSEVYHPLTKLEILDALVQRQTRWREGVVSHALVQMIDHGLLTDAGDGGLHRYGPAASR